MSGFSVLVCAKGLDPQTLRTGTMTKYLIIGRGRLAQHLNFYLANLGQQTASWHRQLSANQLPSQTFETLKTLAEQNQKILLCLPDDEIQNFAYSNLREHLPKTVHFSGARSFVDIAGAHPLMTFSTNLYDASIYPKIPFVIEKECQQSLAEILPGLPNPFYAIAARQKPLYHALCVMAGNFTTLLWKNGFETFSQELRIPAEALTPYLQQITENLIANPEQALTGPIARGDTHTLIHNLDALRDRPEQKLYYAFLNFVLEKRRELGELQYERLNI